MRPRIRTLKPELWQDEKVGSLSHGARLTLIGLITMADDEGRLRELPAAVQGHVFPYDDVPLQRIHKWLDEVTGTGMVARYEVAGRRYLAFQRWSKHQRVNRPNPSELPPPITDQSRINHGSITDKVSPRARARGSDPIPSPLDKHLCSLLANRIVARDEKAKVAPESDRWLTDMRLLREQDGRSADEIERVIGWCQTDSFWAPNILSPGKLRKQFDRLWGQMMNARVVPISRAAQKESSYLDGYPPEGAA